MNPRWLAAPLLVAALWALLWWTPWDKPASLAPEPSPAAPTLPAPHVPEPARVAPADQAPSPTLQTRPPVIHSTRLPQVMDFPAPQAQGPVRALKQRFGSESTSASSRTNEAKVKATFLHSNPPLDLLDDVVCRRSVCRIATRWRQDRALAFMASLTELRRDFDSNPGIDDPGAPDAEHFRRIELYVELPPARTPLP